MGVTLLRWVSHRRYGTPDMRSIDDFNAHLGDWIAKSEGRRIPHRAVLRQDRDTENVFLLMVEFSSYDVGMANSSRPETGEFANFLGQLCDPPLKFRNLDVWREEDLSTTGPRSIFVTAHQR
jgi:hypothetical protein